MKVSAFFLVVYLMCTGNPALAACNGNIGSLIVDTVFNYRFGKDSIPKPFKEKIKAFKGTDTVQTVIIEDAYLFKNDIFILSGIATRKVKVKTYDECFDYYNRLDGTPCAANGCITGLGSGACAGMLTKSSGSKKLRIKLIIHAYKTQ